MSESKQEATSVPPDENKGTRIVCWEGPPDEALLEALKLNLHDPQCLLVTRGSGRDNAVVAQGGHWSREVVARAMGVSPNMIKVEPLEALCCTEKI